MQILTTLLLADSTDVIKGGPGSGPRPGHAISAEKAKTPQQHVAAADYHAGEAKKAAMEASNHGVGDLMNRIPLMMKARAHKRAAMAHLIASKKLVNKPDSSDSKSHSLHARVSSFAANRGGGPPHLRGSFFGKKDLELIRKYEPLSQGEHWITTNGRRVLAGKPGSDRPRGTNANVSSSNVNVGHAAETANTVQGHQTASAYHRSAANAALKLHQSSQAKFHNSAADAHDRAAKTMSDRPGSKRASNHELDARSASVAANSGKAPIRSHYVRDAVGGYLAGGAAPIAAGAALGAASGAAGGPLGWATGAAVGSTIGATSAAVGATAGAIHAHHAIAQDRAKQRRREATQGMK